MNENITVTSSRGFGQVRFFSGKKQYAEEEQVPAGATVIESKTNYKKTE